MNKAPNMQSNSRMADSFSNNSMHLDNNSEASFSTTLEDCLLKDNANSSIEDMTPLDSTQESQSDSEMNFCRDIKDMDRQEFLSYQKKLIYLERDAENEREVMKTVSAVTGEGMPGVLGHLRYTSSFSTRFGRDCVTFSAYLQKKLFSHGLRKGDNVSIFSGGAACRPEYHCQDGVVFSVSSSEVVVAVDNKHNFVDQLSYCLKHHPSLENIRRLVAGVRAMMEPSGPSARLAAVLFREELPLQPLAALPQRLCCPLTGGLRFFNKKLDVSQQAAVEFVLKQQDLAVVHGPPGTGKTTTLIEIIRQHVRIGIKVLALAPSNLGVDNLCERLDDVGLRVVRIGHPARTTPATQRHTIDALLHSHEGREVMLDINRDIYNINKEISSTKRKDRKPLHKELTALKNELYNRQDRYTKELIKGADVVLCTLLSAHRHGALRHLDDDHFGLTVIDECSQGTEASCYLSVLRSPKLLLAGDHKQLPPTVLCAEASALLTSLMERIIALYGDVVVRMLAVQYRMNLSIMSWSSNVLYDGQLVAHSSVKDHLLCHLPHVKEEERTSVPLMLVDTSDSPGFGESETIQLNGVVVSKSNDGEATLVLGMVKKLLDAGLRQDQVAVITPYSRQVKLVRSLVCTDFPNVEIQTVDGFQGREKEAVILTLVRSNEKGEIGFLAEDRRLNVAVTRAKRHLSVICNTRTLQQNEFLKSFVVYMMENAKVVRAEHMDEENCTKLCADFSNVDLTDVLSPLKKLATKSEPKTEEELAKENEVKRQAKLNRYKFILEKFINSKNLKHYFSCKITSFDRLIIHEVAEFLGLQHYSEGVENRRRIVVTKLQQPSQIEDWCQSSDEEGSSSSSDSSEFGGEDAINRGISSTLIALLHRQAIAGNVPPPQPTTKHCTLCGKNVPAQNYTTHRVACEKKENVAIALQKKKLEEKRLEKEQQAAEAVAQVKPKMRAKKMNGSTCNDDEDFDAVVSSFAANNKRCNQTGCKDRSILMLQACVWCHSCYCLKHFIPESHGCDLHAKQHARASVLREGVIYPGSGVPSKLPHPDKRSQLKRSLHKKISEKEDSRTKQNKK